jgi:hypothetical protein
VDGQWANLRLDTRSDLYRTLPGQEWSVRLRTCVVRLRIEERPDRVIWAAVRGLDDTMEISWSWSERELSEKAQKVTIRKLRDQIETADVDHLEGHFVAEWRLLRYRYTGSPALRTCAVAILVYPERRAP